MSRVAFIAASLAGLLAIGCSSSSSSSGPDATAATSTAPTGDAPTADGTRAPPKPGSGSTPPPNTSAASPIPEGADPGCISTAAAGSLYEMSPKALVTDIAVPLCVYAGKVLLIVNGASSCGYTPQYAPLQTLYAKHMAAGFAVLAFPSRSFNQEFADATDVSNFCTTEYGITFPLFEIADVTGAQTQPVYKWLTTQPGFEGDIPWNFEKFLVGRDGAVKMRIPYSTSPDDPAVVAAIEAELAKP